MSQDEVQFGVIKNFNHIKGYGFVLPDGELKNGIFFHNSNWNEMDPVENGQRVSFTVVSTERGPQAHNVSKAEPHPNTEYGTVASFDAGYGFVRSDAGDSIFVHFTSLTKDGERVLVEGQRVSFVRMRDSKRKVFAAYVTVVSEPEYPESEAA